MTDRTDSCASLTSHEIQFTNYCFECRLDSSICSAAPSSPIPFIMAESKPWYQLITVSCLSHWQIAPRCNTFVSEQLAHLVAYHLDTAGGQLQYCLMLRSTSCPLNAFLGQLVAKLAASCVLQACSCLAAMMELCATTTHATQPARTPFQGCVQEKWLVRHIMP